MDMIGSFEMTSRANWYTLTVVCMVTEYIMCLPLADKSADTLVSTYLKDMY